jgi:hypothetical protein
MNEGRFSILHRSLRGKGLLEFGTLPYSWPSDGVCRQEGAGQGLQRGDEAGVPGRAAIPAAVIVAERIRGTQYQLSLERPRPEERRGCGVPRRGGPTVHLGGVPRGEGLDGLRSAAGTNESSHGARARGRSRAGHLPVAVALVVQPHRGDWAAVQSPLPGLPTKNGNIGGCGAFATTGLRTVATFKRPFGAEFKEEPPPRLIVRCRHGVPAYGPLTRLRHPLPRGARDTPRTPGGMSASGSCRARAVDAPLRHFVTLSRRHFVTPSLRHAVTS